jgi:endogenous inhibitor of DNA gyrase (YacG/DUF329 family)
MKKTFSCKTCGVQFIRDVFPADHKEGRTMEYCSRKCYQDARPKRSKIICQFCKKVIDKPMHQRTIFCSKNCQLEASKVQRKRVCEQCRKIFYVKNEGVKGRFCSHKCMGIAYRGERIRYNCETCGKPVEKPIIHAGKFCSIKCAKVHLRKDPIVYICQECGNQYYKIGSKGRGEKYCSQVCSGKANIAKPNPFYHKNYRGPAWHKIARNIRERDNYECKICGKIGTDKTIDVHHIISFRLFGSDYSSANDPKNLISLCRSCHSKVGHGTIQLYTSSVSSS